MVVLGDSIIDRLRGVQLFSVFTDQELQTLANMCQERNIVAFENIVIEGEQTWGLFLVLEGQVGVFKNAGTGGKLYDIGHLKAGSFFGEMSLIDTFPRSASVRALTDVKLLSLSKDVFNNFLNESPDRKMRFYDSCIQQMVKRLRELNDSYVITQYQLWKTALKGDAKEVA